MEDFSLDEFLNDGIIWGGVSDLPEGTDPNEFEEEISNDFGY